MPTREFNFDGLIGPTHNYAGLSFGNVASAKHQNLPSQPRAAALQGLQKMRMLSAFGVGQCILPPLRRPRVELLRELGFSGPSDSAIVESAFRESPHLVAACFSAASMWAANAATVSPTPDTRDGRLHLTVANLSSTLHRSLEGPSTFRLLESIFPEGPEFQIHPPLPSAIALSDEGAANHTRLTDSHGNPGLEVFVYGKIPEQRDSPIPQLFPARQAHLASQAVARNHQIDSQATLLIQQNPAAIDAGVFHNDVISVGNENVFLCHELAFVDQQRAVSKIKERYQSIFQQELHLIEFSTDELPMKDAVHSYLFNSQLVTLPDNTMVMVCPIECEEIDTAKRSTDRILSEDNPVQRVEFVNLRQSMNNGGGPACLRLRVVLTEAQQQAIHPKAILTPKLADQIESWIIANYREQLEPNDLRDPKLIDESLLALESLADILDLPRSVLLDND